jgi:hypothetical protein
MTRTTEALLLAPTVELPTYQSEAPATITAELPLWQQEVPVHLGASARPAEIDPSFMPHTGRRLASIAEPTAAKYTGWDATSAQMVKLWHDDEAAGITTPERPEIFEALLDNQAQQAELSRQRTLNRVRAQLGVHADMTHQEFSDIHHTVRDEAYHQARADRPRWQRVLGVGRQADRRQARAVVAAVMGTQAMEGPLEGMGDVVLLPRSGTAPAVITERTQEAAALVGQRAKAAIQPVAAPLARLRHAVHTRLYAAVRQPYTDVIYGATLAYYNIFDERSKARWVLAGAVGSVATAVTAAAISDMLPKEEFFYQAATQAMTNQR